MQQDSGSQLLCVRVQSCGERKQHWGLCEFCVNLMAPSGTGGTVLGVEESCRVTH